MKRIHDVNVVVATKLHLSFDFLELLQLLLRHMEYQYWTYNQLVLFLFLEYAMSMLFLDHLLHQLHLVVLQRMDFIARLHSKLDVNSCLAAPWKVSKRKVRYLHQKDYHLSINLTAKE